MSFLFFRSPFFGWKIMMTVLVLFLTEERMTGPLETHHASTGWVLLSKISFSAVNDTGFAANGIPWLGFVR